MIQLNNIELRRRKCNRERPCETCTRLGRPPVSCTYPVPEPGPPYATSINDPPVSMEVNDEDSYRQLSTSKGPTTSAHTKYPTIVSQGRTFPFPYQSSDSVPTSLISLLRNHPTIQRKCVLTKCVGQRNDAILWRTRFPPANCGTRY